MQMIDIRSDTVTQPTEAMRQAMAAAPVGDDVFREDPTVNQLEEKAAQLTGKEAALFVPSGTMGNLIAVLAHCGRGDEVMLGNLAHTYLFEAGGIAALGGVHPFTLKNQADGSLDLDDVVNGIRKDDVHFPVSRLVMIENTHNRCGGTALGADYTARLGKVCRDHGLLLHIDGARIFNAAEATGSTIQELVNPADSITFCLSKGLCAPVGSVLCGKMDFIDQARRLRKQLGGGMRQAGILAAAGIVALDTMVQRIGEDHRRAKKLADRIREVKGFMVDEGSPYTNMIFGNLASHITDDAGKIASRLKERGILVGVTGARRFRLVMHYWIDDPAVDQIADAFAAILG